MHVCVYAICKNEVQFASRWVQSMSEADTIVVLDTGSTDGTAEKLRALGAQVTEEEIRPWRFDTARNRSMELIPPEADICVCTDLDEVFDPGWRALIEEAWTGGVHRLSYRYAWSVNEDGSEGVVFWTDKIHANRLFCWTHPVHEVLTYIGEGVCAAKNVPGVRLRHLPDPGKSRAQYLPLLELSVKEDPDDDRNMHYLGREYLYRERFDDCIRTLHHHLQMPRASWADERAASMRYIARAYQGKNDEEEAQRWLLRAIAEAPHLREGWVEMAGLLCQKKEWEGAAYFADHARRITSRPMSYISEAQAWGSQPYDIGAVAAYWLGQYDRALELIDQALEYSPLDMRLQENRKWILQKLST